MSRGRVALLDDLERLHAVIRGWVVITKREGRVGCGGDRGGELVGKVDRGRVGQGRGRWR